jgi:hypothetical protein
VTVWTVQAPEKWRLEGLVFASRERAIEFIEENEDLKNFYRYSSLTMRQIVEKLIEEQIVRLTEVRVIE